MLLILLLVFEREREREREGWREREREREREMGVRKIDWLTPIRAPTRSQTHNLLSYETTLQPTEPPGQAFIDFFDFIDF